MLFRGNKWQRLYGLFLIATFTISIAILIISGMQGNSPDLIVSDGNGYYAWIRSIFIDGDIDFKNDFEALYFPDPPPFDITEQTPNGLIPNKYPIGVAILEIPGFLLGHGIALLTDFQANGISLPYQVCVTFSLIIIHLFSYYLFFLALKNYGIKDRICFLVSSLSLVGTNLIHYVAKEPTMAHCSGVALINYLIFLASHQSRCKQYFFLTRLLIGLTIGLSLIVRLSNVVLLPFFLSLFQSEFKNHKKLVPIIMGISVMIGVYLISLYLLWGRFVVSSYQSEGFTGSAVNIFQILLGNGYGVFLYHPWYLVLVILNFAGLVRLKSTRFLYAAILLSAASLWLINGLWGFSGDSFGSRAFIELLPPLSLGAGLILSSLFSYQAFKYWLGVPAIVMVMLNFYLWGGYLLHQYPHNGDRTLAQVYFWWLH